MRRIALKNADDGKHRSIGILEKRLKINRVFANSLGVRNSNRVDSTVSPIKSAKRCPFQEKSLWDERKE